MRKVEVRPCGRAATTKNHQQSETEHLKKGKDELGDFPHGNHGNDDLFELGDGNDEAVYLGVPYF